VSSIVTSASIEQTRLRAARPSFIGLVGGELFKIIRMWSTWITLVLMLGAICLPYLVSLLASDFKGGLHADALAFLSDRAQIFLAVLRIFIGFFLTILTANVIGREYQLGTVRILLSRGVGRVQLLFAKMASVVVVAIVVLLIGLLLNVLLMLLMLEIGTGSLSVLSVLNAEFWHMIGLYLLTILVSMGMTILMATAMTSLGRSLIFGLSLSLIWFPADNILPQLLQIGYFVTNNESWIKITKFILGPVLNAMPATLIPKGGMAIGVSPMEIKMVEGVATPVNAELTSTHTWLLIAVYAAIFLAVSIIPTWKRDVKE
jgi:ABC-2 type transport system permease protein